jgi:tetratricopeptide (TPR) repeat protein
MKNIQDTYQDNELPDDELSQEEKAMLKAMLNRNLKEHYSQLLAEQGIRREEAKVLFFNNQRFWMAAAATVALIASAIWFLRPNSAVSQEQLLAKAELPYDFPANIRGGNVTTDDAQWQLIVSAYKSKNFDQVLTLSESFSQKTTDLQFVRGLSFMFSTKHDYQSSVSTLQQLIATGNAPEEVYFYLALAHLHLNQQKPAKDALEKVLSSRQVRQSYKLKAQELMVLVK